MSYDVQALPALQAQLRDFLKPKDRCPFCGVRMDVITWGRMGDRYICNGPLCSVARKVVEEKYG